MTTASAGKYKVLATAQCVANARMLLDVWMSIAILAAVVSTDQIYEALTPDLQHAVMHETYLSTSCASLQEPFRPTKPRQGMKQETGHGE